jgi:hypothetical protein
VRFVTAVLLHDLQRRIGWTTHNWSEYRRGKHERHRHHDTGINGRRGRSKLFTKTTTNDVGNGTVNDVDDEDETHETVDSQV